MAGPWGIQRRRMVTGYGKVKEEARRIEHQKEERRKAFMPQDQWSYGAKELRS